MQVSTDVLRKGKFSNNNGAYRTMLYRIRSTTVPNAAFARMISFETVVFAWNKANWRQRRRLISPAVAACIL